MTVPAVDGPGSNEEQTAAADSATWTAASRIQHDGGLCEIGFRGNGFVFDNELPRHTVHLEPFALDARPVTCGEWIRFIEEGAYNRAELWLSDGWAACQAQQWDAPLYWYQEGDTWQYYTLGGPRTVRRWRARLPRELLRSRRIRALGRRKAADRGRVGDRRRGICGRGELPGPDRASPPTSDRQLLDVRRRLAMDVLGLRSVSGFPPGDRRRRRVQRKVHGEPVRASRRQLRDPGGPRAAHLPELLPAVRQMGLLGPATGARRLIG